MKFDEPSSDELKAAHCWKTVDQVPRDPEMTAFKRTARLHQSRWREEHGYPTGTEPIRPSEGKPSQLLGSRLPYDFARESGANLLTQGAVDAVRARLSNPEPHQTLREDRLWADLLSSMPMCFNLFGDLRGDHDLATDVLKAWMPDTPGTVSDVRFEWSPGRRDETYLGNRTAFDVAFILDLPNGEHGVVGVETKYHEHARVEAPPHAEDRMPRYRAVTEAAACFVDGWEEAIVGHDLQQIWLDHLLALAMLHHEADEWSWARFVLVSPERNVSFASLADSYKQILKVPTTFSSTTVEQVLASGLPEPSRVALTERYLW